MTERKSGITGLLLAAALILVLAACGRNTQPPGGFGFTGAETVCTDGELTGLTLSWSESAGATEYTVLRDGQEVGRTPAEETVFTDVFDSAVSGTLQYVVSAATEDGTFETAPFNIDVDTVDCGDTVVPDPEPGDPDEPSEPDAPIIVSSGTRLAARMDTNLAIDKDGNVWAWGGNYDGLLGQGNFSDYAQPVKLNGIDNAVSVAVGETFAMALDGTGAVFVWGSGYPDVPGLPGTELQLVPRRIEDIPAMLTIAAGEEFALATDEDGNVWAWGDNNFGQLGSDPAVMEASSEPLIVPGLSGVKAVFAGETNAFALHGDGTVSAWGSNSDGQLGLGDTADRWEPEQVPGLENVVQLAAARNQALALTADGTVLGAGVSYMLNDPDSGDDWIDFQAIDGIDSASFVTAGQYHSLAILSDGSAVVWGDGYDTVMYAPWQSEETGNPLPVPNVNGAVAAAIGYEHNVILADSGQVYGWGFNNDGSLGATTPAVVTDFAQVDLPGETTQVAAGDSHTLALLDDGTVWSWGDNNSGQLGIGEEETHTSPIQVAALTDVQAIAAGRYFSLALDGAGKVWAWGSNNQGQLGLGNYDEQREPVQIPSLTGITRIAAGGNTALAMNAAGQVWGWGSNYNGQAGADNVANSNLLVPTVIALGGNAADIAVGDNHSLAVLSDGSVVGFGANNYGQLGVGSDTLTGSHTPVATGVSDAVTVVAGYFTSFAIMADGTVTAWGWGSSGRLGLGSGSTGQEPPTVIADLTGVVALSTVNFHTLALTDAGELFGWGDGYDYQLGQENRRSNYVPVQVSVSNPSVVAAAAESSFVVQDGVLYGIGVDREGQLGQGRLYRAVEPILIEGLPALAQD